LVFARAPALAAKTLQSILVYDLSLPVSSYPRRSRKIVLFWQWRLASQAPFC